MKSVYDKHQNLKLAAVELNMKWQTLYWNLKEYKHPVVGNKEKYGSTTDKLARYTEKLFHKTIPFAKDLNDEQFQAKSDFDIKGTKVDIKSSTKKDSNKRALSKNHSFRWAFSCKVQESTDVDFIICYCYTGYDATDFGEVEKILLIPSEFFKNMQSISVSCRKSKWFDFEVTESELKDFFKTL